MSGLGSSSEMPGGPGGSERWLEAETEGQIEPTNFILFTSVIQSNIFGNIIVYIVIFCCWFILYTWHLLHVCLSLERDPSFVALPEVSKGFFGGVFPYPIWVSKDRGCRMLYAPWGKLWFVILGCTNKIDLTSVYFTFSSLKLLVFDFFSTVIKASVFFFFSFSLIFLQRSVAHRRRYSCSWDKGSVIQSEWIHTGVTDKTNRVSCKQHLKSGLVKTTNTLWKEKNWNTQKTVKTLKTHKNKLQLDGCKNVSLHNITKHYFVLISGCLEGHLFRTLICPGLAYISSNTIADMPTAAPFNVSHTCAATS